MHSCYYKAWQEWKQPPESSLLSKMLSSRGWLAGPPAISWTTLHMPYGRGLKEHYTNLGLKNLVIYIVRSLLRQICKQSYLGHSVYSEYCNAYGLNSKIEKNLRILQKNIAWENSACLEYCYCVNRRIKQILKANRYVSSGDVHSYVIYT